MTAIALQAGQVWYTSTANKRHGREVLAVAAGEVTFRVTTTKREETVKASSFRDWVKRNGATLDQEPERPIDKAARLVGRLYEPPAPAKVTLEAGQKWVEKDNPKRWRKITAASAGNVAFKNQAGTVYNHQPRSFQEWITRQGATLAPALGGAGR